MILEDLNLVALYPDRGLPPENIEAAQAIISTA